MHHGNSNWVTHCKYVYNCINDQSQRQQNPEIGSNCCQLNGIQPLQTKTVKLEQLKKQ